jgi:ketosteroid isomerase-like protein
MWGDYNNGNAQRFIENFANDSRSTIIGSSKFSGTWAVKPDFVGAVGKPLRTLLQGGIKITIDNLISEGDYVAMRSRGKAKTKARGTYKNTYCMVYRIANGKIRQAMEYPDTELVTAAFSKESCFG